MRCFLLLPVVALSACARFEVTHEVTLPSRDVYDGFFDADRGDISYDGTGPEQAFDIAVTTWGKGRTKGRAERRADNTTFGAAISEDWLDVWGRSDVNRAGTDLAVAGPYIFNVEAVTLGGTIGIWDVDGYHTLTGTNVEGAGVRGDVDALADGVSIDLEIYPYDGSIVRLETQGDELQVALPSGLDYDLQIFADPEYGYTVTDLGFDDLILGPDYALGTAGAGTVRVTLIALGGEITVLEAR